jgi:hypothetical protein
MGNLHNMYFEQWAELMDHVFVFSTLYKGVHIWPFELSFSVNASTPSTDQGILRCTSLPVIVAHDLLR